MFLRIFSALAASLFLVACSKGAGDQFAAASGAEGAEAKETIACALNGARDFSERCQIADGGYQDRLPVLIVWHPDGSFRRLLMPGDNTMRTADGAEQAVSMRQGDVLEVAIGSDHYRFEIKPNLPSTPNAPHP